MPTTNPVRMSAFYTKKPRKHPAEKRTGGQKPQKEPEPKAEKRTGGKSRKKNWGPWGPMGGPIWGPMGPQIFLLELGFLGHFIKILDLAYFWPPGWSEMDSSRNFMQVSLFSWFFDDFLKTGFFKSCFFQNLGREKMDFWYFDKQKVWRERPFGHITFLSELKIAFFSLCFISFCQKTVLGK